MNSPTLLDIIRVKIPIRFVWLISLILSMVATYYAMPNFPWWGDTLLTIFVCIAILFLTNALFNIETPKDERGGHSYVLLASLLNGIAFAVVTIFLWIIAFDLQAELPIVAQIFWMIPAALVLTVLMVIIFYGGAYPSDTERFLVWSMEAKRREFSVNYFVKTSGIGHSCYKVTEETLKKGDLFEHGVPMYSYTFNDGSIYHEKIHSINFPRTVHESYVFTFVIINSDGKISSDNKRVRAYKRSVPYKDILRRPVTAID